MVSETTIIAECGQNFMGDMELAREMIELAKFHQASLVKFQLYDHNILYEGHPEIPNVELSFDDAKMLFDYGKEIGIEVFFSVFDVERVRWCEEIGVKRYKIAYLEQSNLVLLKSAYNTKKDIIISSSHNRYMKLEEFPFLSKAKVSILYCVPSYPAKLEWLPNFNYSEPFTYQGFSDHTIGLDVSKIALARGASIIEKHFAIDHQTGIDAEWSMTPDELKELRRFADVVEEVL